MIFNAQNRYIWIDKRSPDLTIPCFGQHFFIICFTGATDPIFRQIQIKIKVTFVFFIYISPADLVFYPKLEKKCADCRKCCSKFVYNTGCFVVPSRLVKRQRFSLAIAANTTRYQPIGEYLTNDFHIAFPKWRTLTSTRQMQHILKSN